MKTSMCGGFRWWTGDMNPHKIIHKILSLARLVSCPRPLNNSIIKPCVNLFRGIQVQSFHLGRLVLWSTMGVSGTVLLFIGSSGDIRRNIQGHLCSLCFCLFCASSSSCDFYWPASAVSSNVLCREHNPRG